MNSLVPIILQARPVYSVSLLNVYNCIDSNDVVVQMKVHYREYKINVN